MEKYPNPFAKKSGRPPKVLPVEAPAPIRRRGRPKAGEDPTYIPEVIDPNTLSKEERLHYMRLQASRRYHQTEIFGSTVHKLIKKGERREALLKCLEVCLPDKSQEERDAIVSSLL